MTPVLLGQTPNPWAGHFNFGDLCSAVLLGAVARPLADCLVISQTSQAAEARGRLAGPSCYTELLLRNTTSKRHLLVRDYEEVSA
jgi:hypothetical protein